MYSIPYRLLSRCLTLYECVCCVGMFYCTVYGQLMIIAVQNMRAIASFNMPPAQCIMSIITLVMNCRFSFFNLFFLYSFGVVFFYFLGKYFAVRRVWSKHIKFRWCSLIGTLTTANFNHVCALKVVLFLSFFYKLETHCESPCYSLINKQAIWFIIP